MPLEFPWQAFIESQRQKEAQRNRWADALGSLAQAGTQAAIQIPQKNKQKQQWGQAVDQAFPFGPQANPQAEQMRQFAPMLKANPDIGAQIMGTMGKLQNQSTKPMTSIWQNAQGEIAFTRPDDPNGWTELKVSPTTATQEGVAQHRVKALEARNTMWGRSIDTKQINELTKSVGFTPRMISQIQNTATRGQRGLQILSDPQITWQKLNAAGVDFAGIMQGGAPHVGEVINTQFPNWHQTVAKWQTYIEGNNPANVPPEIQQQMKQLLQGVVDIDNQFIQSSNQFNRQMIGPTIQGGLNKKQNSAMDQIQKVMTNASGQGGNSDFSSMSDDELRKIASGGK